MHELSIALNLVQIVEEAARKERAERVRKVHIAVGALSGVVPEALLFSYEVAVRGTLLEGSKLEIDHLPVVIYCEGCGAERELPGVQSFLCPVCQTPSELVVRGKELEIRALEVEP